MSSHMELEDPNFFLKIIKDSIFYQLERNQHVVVEALKMVKNHYRKQDKKGLMHTAKAEVFALLGAYSKAVDELQTSYSLIEEQPLLQKRIKARILQFQDQENKLKRL